MNNSSSSDIGNDIPASAASFEGIELSVALTVSDIRQSLEWYRDIPGFSVDREFERDGALTAVSLKAGAVRILITQDNGAKGADRVRGEGFSMQITTAQSIVAVAEGIRARGGVLESEPVETPWGVWMFRLRDPDGFRFTISAKS